MYKSEGFGKPFGPVSQVGDRIGCGIKFPRDEDGDIPQQVKVFFTHNRKEVCHHFTHANNIYMYNIIWDFFLSVNIHYNLLIINL